MLEIINKRVNFTTRKLGDTQADHLKTDKPSEEHRRDRKGVKLA